MKTMMMTLCLACALVAAACGGGDDKGKGNAAKGGPVVFRKAVAAEYKDRKPPAEIDLANADVIAKGKELFGKLAGDGGGNCLACHGEGGKGDGPLGKGANPAPTDLTSAEFQNSVKDDYIFWRIMTGGVGGPQGTAMTGFIGGSEEQAWQIVAYVRSLKGK